MHGQEDVHRPSEPFDVSVERRPEVLGGVRRHLRIDHGECLGQLGVDGADFARPVQPLFPLGVCGGPAPESGSKLANVHLGKT